MVKKYDQSDILFRIDWQGYDTDDPRKKEERVDVSPAGTEGIFIEVTNTESSDAES